MKPKTFSAIGGWQSFLFCAGLYVVALFFSIFVCSAVFFVVNSNSTGSKNVAVEKLESHSGNETLAAVAK
jgi:hypothetical protein